MRKRWTDTKFQQLRERGTTMKRLIAFFVAVMLLLSGCGEKEKAPVEDQSESSNRAATMTIVKTQFSPDTEEILKLLDVKGGFFDFAVDSTINGYSMNVWVLTNGEWVSSGEISGKIENKQGQVGIQLLEDGCNFYQLSATGHTKYSVKYDTHLKECSATGRMVLNPEEQITVIEPGKEQFLFLELGWKDPMIQADVTEDFRTSNCDAGVAATITFTAAPGAN